MISESTFDTKKDIAPVSVVILDINCPDLLCEKKSIGRE